MLERAKQIENTTQRTCYLLSVRWISDFLEDRER